MARNAKGGGRGFEPVVPAIILNDIRLRRDSQSRGRGFGMGALSAL